MYTSMDAGIDGLLLFISMIPKNFFFLTLAILEAYV